MDPTYDIHKSYEENYDKGPFFEDGIPERPALSSKIKFFDLEVNSPLGVPAGPLLNSNWIKLYAELGWDIPVYKTVRTVEYNCHPAPNCVFADVSHQLGPTDIGGDLQTLNEDPDRVEDLTITNSFGMPSKAPEIWMSDVEKSNNYLKAGQVMVVSVVGTPGEGKDLISDYVRCAEMAKEAGAKVIEVNYSCPNVCSGEGSVFADPELSSSISKAVKKAIGSTPLMIKMGVFSNLIKFAEVVEANARYVDGIAGINTVSMKVYNPEGKQALPGKGRLSSGLCGSGIHDVSQMFTEQLAALRAEKKYDFLICGVGGIMTEADIDQRLGGGADIVMSATGAMWDPMLAYRWHDSINN